MAFDEWPFYREHPGLIPALWLGGFATHGLLIGGFLAVALFAVVWKKPFLALADTLAVPAALLMAMGRMSLARMIRRRQHRHDVRHVRDLPDHLLKDIGIRRGNIVAAVYGGRGRY